MVPVPQQWQANSTDAGREQNRRVELTLLPIK